MQEQSCRWSVASLLRGEFPPELHWLCMWEAWLIRNTKYIVIFVSEICELHCVADAWYWCRNIYTCILLYLFYWLIAIPDISFPTVHTYLIAGKLPFVYSWVNQISAILVLIGDYMPLQINIPKAHRLTATFNSFLTFTLGPYFTQRLQFTAHCHPSCWKEIVIVLFYHKFYLSNIIYFFFFSL